MCDVVDRGWVGGGGVWHVAVWRVGCVFVYCVLFVVLCLVDVARLVSVCVGCEVWGWWWWWLNVCVVCVCVRICLYDV